MSSDIMDFETVKQRRTAPLLFRISIFPLVMSAAVGATLYQIAAGTGPADAFLIPQLIAFAVIALLERVYPHHMSWNNSQRDIRVDFFHSMTIAVSIGLVTPLVLYAGLRIGSGLSASIGLGLWPNQWPILIQAALALTLAELPGYWIHRLEHEWDGLWRFHATHHSAPRLYWLNAGRFHPIDTLIVFIPSFMLLVVLGCNETVLTLFTLVTAVHGIFQHANLQMNLGPLNWFFSMAELHRWHHSKRLGEANCNYGQTISVWDTLFGTRYLPSDREPPEEIGICELPSFPMTWWAQILSPFKWQSIRTAGSSELN
jgi:sterol desaturase/sphingolipid hydroxylase (fatty acid hydroxylase superfamily)